MNRLIDANSRDRMYRILSRNSVLGSMTDDVFNEVVDKATFTSLNGKETLFSQDQTVDRFYYLCSGRIKLYRLSENGDEKIIEFIEPGNLFAFTLLFVDNAAYPVSATALSASEVIGIETHSFRKVLTGSTDLCFRIMAAMSSRMMKLIQEIDALSLQSGSGRVASYLLAHTSHEAPIFDLPISKKMLASRLSLKPETLSRILHCMATKGSVEIHDKRIKVLNREELSTTVCPLHV
ncbi:MAG: Crp/Fnr family transcriptional regulator [bacterium]